jgi:hypothetical protein
VEYPGEHAAVFGIDGILGMEYKFNKAPLCIGMDIKPFIDIYDGVPVISMALSLSVLSSKN